MPADENKKDDAPAGTLQVGFYLYASDKKLLTSEAGTKTLEPRLAAFGCHGGMTITPKS